MSGHYRQVLLAAYVATFHLQNLLYFVILRSFEHNSSGEITLHSFLNCVGQLKFRGTSVLLRLPKSLFGHKEGILPDLPPPSPVPSPPEDNREDRTAGDDEQLKSPSEGTDSGEDLTLPSKMPLNSRRRAVLPDVDEEMELSSVGEQATDGAPPKKKLQLSISAPTLHQADRNSHHQQEEDKGATKHHHSEEEYSIATHFVKVRRNGLLVDVSTLWDFMATDAVTGSVRNILSHSRPGMQRQSSIFAFDPVSCL